MRNIQVNMKFNADTSAAQSQIQQLQQSLQNIANTKVTVQGGSIDQAVQSAKILNQHLTAATNMNTGRIDFSALQTSLKVANTDLITLSNNLLAVGPKGQQAFSQVANAVAHAELSVKKTNKALANFGTTLMNTIKWQAASTMIHGVMGAFSSAVGHVEKLDKSLNSIQIVTGKTAGEMAVFAKQAQEASRALSSTTQEYADAALIYFQQGLGEKAIAERTEATLKMAKVTGDAVATVSDQLTAIWNNFDDGSKSLEHYGDVITALGAATASSTDEIADGLQKFAAIAETVGLSYEYAATALATVTAETRQSADVVGTAFKTLFARIQGLSLGETLDDGTTLNKYSEALAKVGIDIKLSNGELKDMNNILDEMGDKWKRLNEDQQVALAQTVGGVRQYNQLVALMDNWDTFKINLDIAENSKGELDKQFEIYQSSVEASAADLKNATQSLYENLLSPEMITGFNEALADTIGLINTIVENAGGIGKLFEFGGLLLLQMVLPKLQGFLMSAATHMKDFIGYTKAAKMYELDTMAKTSHAIAGTSQRTAEHQATTKIGKGAQYIGDKASGLMDRAFVATAGSTNTATQAAHGILYAATSARDAIKSQTAASETAFNPNAASPIKVAGVDMDASAMSMRNQMIKEEAGYTATILDTKKQILALENGLTDKQRESYKAYSDQVAKEQEALRLAREKQAVTKDTAEKSSRSGVMKVGASQEGRDRKQQQNEEIRASKKAELDKEYEKRLGKMDKHSRTYGSDKDALDKEISAKKAEVNKTSYVSNKQVDFKGDETRSMVEGFKDSDMSATGQAVTQSMTDSLTQSTDGSGPAASVENLEKLGKLQAQYNADAAKASGIYSELSGNIGEAGKRTEQQQKTLKKTGDTMKSLGNDAKKGLVKNLEASADAMEGANKDASELRKVIAQLGQKGADIDLGNLNPEEMSAVTKSVGNLEQGLTEAGTSAGELANAMAEDMASATGQDAKIFTGIAEDAQAAKASALDADGAAKQLQNTLNTRPPIMPDPFGSVVQGATKAVSAFTSFAMGAQMLSTGITTAFNENASAVEQLMGVMMILQGVMSTVNAIQTAANVVDTIAVAVKAAKAKAAGKEAQAEGKGTIVTTTNTVATSANAVAKLFAAMASKGLAGIIAGVLGAALIVSTIAIVANTVATQQETEAKQEATAAAEEEAAARKENADAIREETKELNKNADEYRKLYAVYEETKEVKSDLMEASYKLASSLGVENASLLVLSGNYEELNKEIEEHLRLKNQEAMAAAKESTKAAGVSYAIGTGSSEGYWSNMGTDGDYSMGFWAGEENVQWITNFLNSDAGKKYKDAGIGFYSGKLMADYTDEAQIPYLMELFKEMIESDEFREKGKKAGYDISGGTLFQSWGRMKEEQGDRFTGLAEAIEAQNEQARITGITESGLHEAKTLDEFIAAYERYKNFVVESADPLADATKIITDANEYLRTHSSYGELYKQMDAFNDLPEKVQQYADANGWTKDSAKMDILLSTYFNDRMTKDEIKRTLELSQQIADNNDIMAKVKFIPEMAGQLTDEMTYDDWATWFKDFEAKEGDFETVTGMSKKDFMSMGAESAKEFLNTLIPDAQVKQHILSDNIELWTKQRNVLEAQKNTLPLPDADLSESELDFVATWGKMSQADIDAGGTGALSKEQMYELLNLAKGSGLLKEDSTLSDVETLGVQIAGREGRISGTMSREEVKQNASSFFREQTSAKEGIELQNQIDNYDTQIAQAKQESEYYKVTAVKQDAIKYDLDTKEIDVLADSLETVAQKSDIFSKNLIDNKEVAREAAKQLTRYNRAVEAAADNMDDWKAALKGTDVGKQSKAVKELSETYADMFDLDATDFSNEFLRSTDNLELMEKALNGSEEAYNDLQTKIAMGIIEKHFKELPGITQEMIDEITSQKIKAGDLIEFDSKADGIGSQLFNMYSQAVQAAQLGGASVADAMSQANALMQAIGFEPPEVEMEEKEITLTGDIPDGWTPQEDGSVTTTDASGKTVTVQGVRAVKTEGGTYEYKQTILVPKGGGKITKSTENLGGSKPSNTGGSGSKPKKTSDARKDKSETVERYKEINDKLDDSSRAMDKASKAADRLYGASRLKALDKLNKALKEEIKNLEAKKKQTEEYLALDREALDQAAAETGLGIKFEYDENGNITNYDEMMTIIHNAREALLDSFGDTIDEDEQKQLDAFDKKAENVVNKQEQYDDTREEKEDVEDQIEDRYNQWQDNNYEKLSYKLELKLEINDRELELIDTKLDLIADDVFKRAEGLALLSSKIEPFKETATDLVDQKATLDTALANGDISQEDYVEGLKEIYSATIQNVQAMKEFDEAMKSYYGDTLDMANEEIKKYTDHMEHSVSVLDHYSSLLDIFGESTDYKKMGTILKGQADVLGDQVTVAKQTLDMNKAAADDRWKEYQEALNRGDSAAAELHKEEYFKALAAADEAEENFLAKSEEWAEALKAVLENALKDAGRELEKALTDGASFDALATKMERASSLQEEYLTNTNKIYETNKMINTAQQAIDKTTNTVAKQRLANFQKETAQLQKKEKLSQYELDIQQAKYDLLLAQITLEEAQQAKSTVRLQRDSEGNFGYVYTADQNQIADAQQEMLDAENALYNKGLEGANDYAQKYQQTMQEMYDTLTEIQEKYLNGEYETYQEYQAAMVEAQDYYYQKLQDYSDLYKVAISADNRVVADAWSSNFNDMIFNTEQWMTEVTGYIGDVSRKFQEWDTTVKTLKEGTLGDNLGDLAGKVKNITDESKSLVQTLTDEKDGVIPNLTKEIEGVGKLTTEYGKNRGTLLLLTDAQLAYADSLNQTIKAQSELDNDSGNNSSSSGNSGSSSSGNSGSSSSSNNGSDSSDNDKESPDPPSGGKVSPPLIKLYMNGDFTGGTKTFSADKIKSMTPEGTNGKLYRAEMFDSSEYIYTNKLYADRYYAYKKPVASLDTGGYTGSWGHEGKLAMLHEKELILNAQDTSNFLASLEVLREIMKTIDLHSSYAQISGMLSSPIYRDYNEPQILEQQVHIEASFPGVQDRNEIEEAFNNLMNRATQFVNRK